MATDEPKGEVVTETGWRIRGSLAESLGGGRRDLHPVGEAFWGGTFRVHTLGRQDTTSLMLEALEGWLSEVNGTPVDLSDELTLPGGERRGLYWSPEGRGGRLLARHPHPAFPGRACVTHLWLSTRAAQTKLRIRVGPEEGIDSIRGRVGVGQLVLPWMTALMDRAHYAYEGGQSRIVKLDKGEIPKWVEEEVLNPDRTVPLAILSPLEEGGYVVDPERLARELLGIAHLHLITDHAHTFTLSDELGSRHLSAFWGALRILLPKFGKSDHPHSHPLLLSDPLSDPLIRASEFGSVLIQLGPLELDLPLPEAYEEDRKRAVAKAAVEVEAAEAKAAATEAETEAETAATEAETAASTRGADATGTASEDAQGAEAPSTLVLPDRFTRLVESGLALLTDLRSEVGAQQRKLHGVEDTVRGVKEEIEQMRTQMKLGGTDVDRISRQLDRATSLIRRLLPPEDDADLSEGAQSDEKEESHEILDVVRRARTVYVDDLLVLDSAEASAKESHYENPGTVETIFGVMAEISRQRQAGELGQGLKFAFSDYGLAYHSGISKSSPERIRRQHEFTDEEGRMHICEEHISVGISYDSRFCLRVYFSSKSPQEHRLVVGHVGRHLETMSTT